MARFADQSEDEPSVEEVIDAVLQDKRFRDALGDSERAAVVAEAAVKAAFTFIGLWALAVEAQHEVAGHG